MLLNAYQAQLFRSGCWIRYSTAGWFSFSEKWFQKTFSGLCIRPLAGSCCLRNFSSVCFKVLLVNSAVNVGFPVFTGEPGFTGTRLLGGFRCLRTRPS